MLGRNILHDLFLHVLRRKLNKLYYWANEENNYHCLLRFSYRLVYMLIRETPQLNVSNQKPIHNCAHFCVFTSYTAISFCVVVYLVTQAG